MKNGTQQNMHGNKFEIGHLSATKYVFFFNRSVRFPSIICIHLTVLAYLNSFMPYLVNMHQKHDAVCWVNAKRYEN